MHATFTQFLGNRLEDSSRLSAVIYFGTVILPHENAIASFSKIPITSNNHAIF